MRLSDIRTDLGLIKANAAKARPPSTGAAGISLPRPVDEFEGQASAPHPFRERQSGPRAPRAQLRGLDQSILEQFGRQRNRAVRAHVEHRVLVHGRGEADGALADVLISSLGLIGALVLIAVLFGIVTAGLMFWFRSRSL